MAKRDIVLVLEFDDKGTATVKQVTATVKKELDKTGKSAQKMGKDFDAMRRQVEGATKGQSKFKSMLKSTAIQMAAGLGIMTGMQQGVVAIKRAVVDFIQTGRKFERSWANVTTMLTISQQETKRLKWELIGLSPTLGDVTELSAGMYQVLSASIEPAKAVKFLGEAAKSAAAGVTEAFVAVDALTTVINAYGMQAEQVTEVSDIMFQTVKRGKLTYEGMAGALGTVVPIAAQVGVRFEEIAAAMATLTRQGIDVNTTTVQLRQVMVSVLKPTSEAQTMAAALGLEFNAAALEAKGLSKFLADVKEKTKGDAEALTALFGNVRALTGVMGLAGVRAGEFTHDLKLMGDAAGSTEEAFRKQMESLDFWIRTMKNQLNAMKVAFYEGLIEPVKSTITSQKDLDKTFKSQTETAKMLGEAIGAVGNILKVTAPLWKKEIEKISNLDIATAMIIERISLGLYPAYSSMIKKKRETLYLTIQETKENKKFGESMGGVWGEIYRGLVYWKKQIEYTVEQGMSFDETYEYLKKLRKEQQEFAADTKVIDALQRMEIKTLSSLRAEFDQLVDDINTVSQSGKDYSPLLKDQAKKAMELAEVLRLKLSPEILALAGAYDKLMILEPVPIETGLVETEKRIKSVTMTFLGLTPELIEHLVQWKRMTDTAAEYGATLETQVIGQLRKTIKDFEKMKGLLTPEGYKTMIAEMVRLAKIVGVELPKPIKEMAEKLDLLADGTQDKWRKTFDFVVGMAMQFGNQIGTIFSQMHQNEMIRIENEYAARQKAIDTSLMSEEEKYDALEKLDEEMQKKRLQAQRRHAAASKAVSLLGAIVNTAEAITKALTVGPIIGPILAAAVGALGAIQVATIAAQPLPALAKGGIVHEEQVVKVAEKAPEVIAPLPDLMNIIREAIQTELVGVEGKKTFHVYSTVYIGGTKFQDEVVKTVNERGDDIRVRTTSMM